MDEKEVKLLAYRGASACLVGSRTKESSATRKSASERLPFTTLRPRRSSKLSTLRKASKNLSGMSSTLVVGNASVTLC